MDFLDSLKQIKSNIEEHEKQNKLKEEQKKIEEKEKKLMQEFIDFMDEK